MPSCSRANTAKQMAGAPVSISCLCWPRVTRHSSEVTPALFHKVNLPLQTWYLLTRLIEIDGCMTFIDFFFFTSRFWSWRRLFGPPRTSDVSLVELLLSLQKFVSCKHRQKKRERPRWLWAALTYSPNCWTGMRLRAKPGLSLCSPSLHYFDEIKLKYFLLLSIKKGYQC